MDKPIIADNKPKAVMLTKDEEYYFCSCGRSKNQPFVMALMQEQLSSPNHLQKKRMERRGYVFVKAQGMLLFAMDHINSFQMTK